MSINEAQMEIAHLTTPDEMETREQLDELRMLAARGTYIEAAVAVAQRRAQWIALAALTTEDGRDEVVAASRLVARKDPMGRNATRIWESFVVGRGMKIAIRPEAENDPEANALERAITHPSNRQAFRLDAQRRAYRTLLTEGELHTILFHGAPGTIPIARYAHDSTEFQRPITHPQDPDTILYQVRKITTEELDYNDEGPVWKSGQKQIQYIRAWDADDTALRDTKRPPIGQTMRAATALRLTTNQVRHRGWPMSEPVIDWIRAYRGFMEDRVTYSRAVAKFAWQVKGAANEEQLRNVLNQIENPGEAQGRNLGPGAGKVFATNAYDLAPIRASTGGMDTRSDGRMIRQQISAGTSITEPNLTGDPSVGNLASLTAMDGTMARNFETDQITMIDHYYDLISAIIAGNTTDARRLENAIRWVRDNVTITFDPVVGVETNLMAQAATLAAPYLPGEWLTTYLLRLFGEQRPEDVVARQGTGQDNQPNESNEDTATEPRTTNEPDEDAEPEAP